MVKDFVAQICNLSERARIERSAGSRTHIKQAIDTLLIVADPPDDLGALSGHDRITDEPMKQQRMVVATLSAAESKEGRRITMPVSWPVRWLRCRPGRRLRKCNEQNRLAALLCGNSVALTR